MPVLLPNLRLHFDAKQAYQSTYLTENPHSTSRRECYVLLVASLMDSTLYFTWIRALKTFHS